MPLWGRDGKELFYRGDGWLMAVPVSLEPSFALETPQRLFEDRYHLSIPYYPSFTYDIAPDGGRFLMIEPDERVEPERIHVMLNWLDELERLAGND